MASNGKSKRSQVGGTTDKQEVRPVADDVRPVTDNVQVTDSVQATDEPKVEQPQVVEESKETKSDMFRRLYDEGKDIPTIARATGSNYSFVRSVVTRHAKDKGQPITSRIKGEKADLFRRLWDEGDMTIGQIAHATNSNYSYVHTVISKHRRDRTATVQTKVVA